MADTPSAQSYAFLMRNAQFFWSNPLFFNGFKHLGFLALVDDLADAEPTQAIFTQAGYRVLDVPAFIATGALPERCTGKIIAVLPEMVLHPKHARLLVDALVAHRGVQYAIIITTSALILTDATQYAVVSHRPDLAEGIDLALRASGLCFGANTDAIWRDLLRDANTVLPWHAQAATDPRHSIGRLSDTLIAAILANPRVKPLRALMEIMGSSGARIDVMGALLECEAAEGRLPLEDTADADA